LTPDNIIGNKIAEIVITSNGKCGKDSSTISIETLIFNSEGKIEKTRMNLLNQNYGTVLKYLDGKLIEELLILEENDTLLRKEYKYLDDKLDEIVAFSYLPDKNIEISFFRYLDNGLLDNIRITRSDNLFEVTKYFDEYERIIREVRVTGYELVEYTYKYDTNRIEYFKEGKLLTRKTLNEKGLIKNSMRVYENNGFISEWTYEYEFNENGMIKRLFTKDGSRETILEYVYKE